MAPQCPLHPPSGSYGRGLASESEIGREGERQIDRLKTDKERERRERARDKAHERERDRERQRDESERDRKERQRERFIDNQQVTESR